MSIELELAAGWRLKAAEMREIGVNRAAEVLSAREATALAAQAFEQCAGELERLRESKEAGHD